MSEWKECKVGRAPFEIIDGDRGNNYPQQDEFHSDGYCLFLNAGNVTTAGFAFNECHFVSKEKDQILRKGKLQRNDIVLTTRGTVGNIGYFNERIPYDNIRINSGMVIIRSDHKGILPEYTYHLFKYLKSDFDLFATGSAQPQLPIRDLKEIVFSLPPLPEQRAIAGVLSTLDDKIDLLNRQNKTLEGMAEAVFRDKFMEKNGNWSISKLSEHVDVFRGLSYKGSGLCVQGEGVPMHNLNSVLEGGGYKYQGIKYYKGEFKERHLVKSGDVIVANTEQGHKYLLIGYPAIVPKLFGNKGIFSQHIFKLAIKRGSILSNAFLYYLLKNRKIWEQVVGATNGSTVNMLAANGLETVELNIPPKALIDEFTDFAGAGLEKQEQNVLAIGALSRLRDILLPKLMTGELRVGND